MSLFSQLKMPLFKILPVSSGLRSFNSVGKYWAFSPDSRTSTSAFKTVDAVKRPAREDSGATSHTVRERTISNAQEKSR